MKIKRYNETIRYSEQLTDKIERFGWDKGLTKYYIGRPNDSVRDIVTGNSYSKLDPALEYLNQVNEEFGDTIYCLFEGKFRVVSSKEIDIILDTKKYNI
jgi:hypothetical protein